jgi:hypothetical protein
MFEELMGSNWTVKINEENKKVAFIIKPVESASIDILDTYNLDEIKSTISASGADEAKIYFGDESGIIVRIKRKKLPDDYRN